MRSVAFTLGAVALFSLGATSSTNCLSSLLPILTPPLTISIHVINDAYDPVTVQLVTDSTSSTSLVDPNGATPTADTGTGSAATQPSGGSTVSPGEDIEIGTSLPCAAIAGPVALQATYKNSCNVEVSATSPKLYLDNDFSCGDRVNFIIRPAAMVGIVVGYEIVGGGAD